VIANSYCVRKGLSRKAQLSIYLEKYVRKHPGCELSRAVPKTLVVDLWDAFDSSLAGLGISFKNRLESCLWEVKQLFEYNESKPQKEGSLWIIKPSATNKVRNFSMK
jgi:tubulin--tyrosine ligase